MHAARNLRLCTKDCVCLFVCPTKATDTENGQIDFSKCLDGCRLCVDACPSHALYLVEGNYAEPADKPQAVAEKLFALLDRKTEEEVIAAVADYLREIGAPLIIVTHSEQMAQKFSNSLIRIDCGRAEVLQ